MDVEIDIRKSGRDNASAYYESSKRKRLKAERALTHIAELEARIERMKSRASEEKEAVEVKRKPEWFEEFRWFVSSEGVLVIGGRDAMQNEKLVKKKTGKSDIVFHTDLAGSPFVIVKAELGQSEATLKEAAAFTAAYSRAWKAGLGSTDVYWVNPEQVSKRAPAGEYIGRGAFMIYGKKNYFKRVPLETAIGWDGEKVVYGPRSSVEPKAKQFVTVRPAPALEQTQLAKEIRRVLKEASLDDIVRALPAGKGEIVARLRKG